tara:strand:- start:74 stop:226 length:153 start_codon:yes stop_codon:yes gene_type:complete
MAAIAALQTETLRAVRTVAVEPVMELMVEMLGAPLTLPVQEVLVLHGMME